MNERSTTSLSTRSAARRLLSRLRWYELGPEVVLVAGLGLFAVTEPHAAVAGLNSSKALTLMVVVAVGWIIARIVTGFAVRWPAVRLALFGAAALAILKVVVLPAYHDQTVVEIRSLSLPANAPTVAGTPATSTEPIKLSTGPLHGIDHRASGTVNLYRAPDGHIVVGLEEFDIQPGPAYVLYLVSGDDRRDHDGGTRLERLRGNRGTQFYDAPADVDPSARWTVLVWCETFDVPVANATPA